MQALLALTVFKFISWSISLGSGTSGGTLAPLFTIGGGLGGALGVLFATWWPALGVDPRIAALVGMAALFAGASRALLTSVVFAFETTRQPIGLLPLLGGCSASYLISSLLMQYSIMTEKIARRGVKVSNEYAADSLAHLQVADFAKSDVASLAFDDPVSTVLTAGVLRHHGYPVLDGQGQLSGVITRRDLLEASPTQRVGDLIKRPPSWSSAGPASEKR